MIWKLLPTISAPMPFQMALDEILFEDQKRKNLAPFLRFYYSSEPWISAGCSFRKEKDLESSELIRRNPAVPSCRRVTGGGCVLHGKDLIFSLCARMECDLDRLASAQTSYNHLHESVKMALQKFGVGPAFYNAEGDLPKGADCFHFPVPSDLHSSGQKVAGGAQKRSQGVLLHQESIQVPNVPGSELIQAVCDGLEAVFGATLDGTDLDPELYFQAEQMMRFETADDRQQTAEKIKGTFSFV